MYALYEYDTLIYVKKKHERCSCWNWQAGFVCESYRKNKYKRTNIKNIITFFGGMNKVEKKGSMWSLI